MVNLDFVDGGLPPLTPEPVTLCSVLVDVLGSTAEAARTGLEGARLFVIFLIQQISYN